MNFEEIKLLFELMKEYKVDFFKNDKYSVQKTMHDFQAVHKTDQDAQVMSDEERTLNAQAYADYLKLMGVPDAKLS